MGCCGNKTPTNYGAGSAAGQVKVQYIGPDPGVQYIKVTGAATGTSYGWKIHATPWCMRPEDVAAEPTLYQEIGPCVG